jgi:hypothetical protein
VDGSDRSVVGTRRSTVLMQVAAFAIATALLSVATLRSRAGTARLTARVHVQDSLLRRAVEAQRAVESMWSAGDTVGGERLITADGDTVELRALVRDREWLLFERQDCEACKWLHDIVGPQPPNWGKVVRVAFHPARTLSRAEAEGQYRWVKGSKAPVLMVPSLVGLSADGVVKVVAHGSIVRVITRMEADSLLARGTTRRMHSMIDSYTAGARSLR